jgi:hypothetical protein
MKTKENFMYIIEEVSEVEQWMKIISGRQQKATSVINIRQQSGVNPEHYYPLGCYAVVLKRKPCCFVFERNLQANLCGMLKVIENKQ